MKPMPKRLRRCSDPGGIRGSVSGTSCAVDVSRTIKCALFGDAMVLGSILEEHGAQVRRPDDDAPLTMVATGTIDGITAAVAQLRHELVGAGPVVIEGEEFPAAPGDAMCSNHAEAMLPETGPAARGVSPGSAERAGGAHVSVTVTCASFWDALVLRLMLEEQGAKVHRPDEVASLTMVATGTLDGIRTAAAQLIHEFPGSGPVVIEGEDRVYGADNWPSAAPRGHIGEETRATDPAQSQAIPRPRSASTADGSQSKLPAEPGDHIYATAPMLPETEPAPRAKGRGSAERADGAQPQAADSGPATPALDAHERADPDQLQHFEVVIVQAEARYHRGGCTLIRLLGSDDLEVLTRQEAQAEGYVPCRACKPDNRLLAST